MCSFPRLLAIALALPVAAQTETLRLPGAPQGERFGSSLAFVGGVDGDGHADLAVGAPFASTAVGPAGQVRVVSGRSHQILLELDGTSAGERFGWSLSGCGDVNGDGRGDLVVGAPYWNGAAGYAAVFDGRTGAMLHRVQGSYTLSLVGWSVAGGGEVDGDGVPDFLVGEPQSFYGSNYHGYLRVYSGASGALILRQQVAGPNGRFRMGFACAFFGDVDGDGFDEYVAGAPGEGAQSAPGVVAYDGASHQLLWQIVGPNGGSEFGYSVARLADLDGDGASELLVGAPEIGCASPCASQGFASIVSGATGALVRTHAGSHPQAAFGRAVTGTLDLDGDGVGEYAIAQPGASLGGDNGASVAVFSGIGGALVDLGLPAATIAWGAALASGDATGDGLHDLVVGAPYEWEGSVRSGVVHAISVVRSAIAYCESETNSLGCTPAIAGVGSPSGTLAQPFEVRASGVLNNKGGLLFYSFKPRQTPFQGGHMCIVSPTVRTAVQSSGGSAPPASDCSGVLTLDFNARIRSGIDPLLVAGEEVFAQYWSRDPADQSTTNLTNALAFYIHP